MCITNTKIFASHLPNPLFLSFPSRTSSSQEFQICKQKLFGFVLRRRGKSKNGTGTATQPSEMTKFCHCTAKLFAYLSFPLFDFHNVKLLRIELTCTETPGCRSPPPPKQPLDSSIYYSYRFVGAAGRWGPVFSVNICASGKLKSFRLFSNFRRPSIGI